MEPTAIGPDGTLYYECHACGETLEPNAQEGLRWAWPKGHADERVLLCDACWEEYPEVQGIEPEDAECANFERFGDYAKPETQPSYR